MYIFFLLYFKHLANYQKPHKSAIYFLSETVDFRLGYAIMYITKEQANDYIEPNNPAPPVTERSHDPR